MKKIRTILILIFIPLSLFGQDLIPFQSNGLWGYKDTLENTVIEPKYQYARKFQDKYAVIAQEYFLEIIDKQDNQIIYPEYEFIRYIGNERFIFGCREKYFGEYNLGVITSNNEILVRPQYYGVNLKNGY
jgi:hypothetical protein